MMGECVVGSSKGLVGAVVIAGGSGISGRIMV